jgi:hypothetical protein
MGTLYTGPSGTNLVGANGSVGDVGWVLGGNKGLQEGHHKNDFNMEFPEVLAPYDIGLQPPAKTVLGTNYVGVMGNGHVRVLPVWELIMDKLPDDARRIATERVKWSRAYQDKYGIRSGEARNLSEGKDQEIQHLANRVYRALGLSGYARIDVRMDAEGHVYVLEANPNPQIAHDEDFSDSAEKAGYTYKDLLQELLNIGLRWRPAKVA